MLRMARDDGLYPVIVYDAARRMSEMMTSWSNT